MKASITSSSSRDYYMDNLRAVLIVLVVLGHFLSKMSYCVPYKNLSYFLYLFHMPCFVFVSGYFSKSIGTDYKKLACKVGTFLWMFLLFQLSLTGLCLIFTGSGLPSFLRVSSAPWYLLALCIWYLFLPILAAARPLPMILLSIVIGIAAGFDPGIGSSLSLSRILVFFPFFAMGYYLDETTRKKLYCKKLIPVAAILFVSTMIVMIIKGQMIYDYMTIIYGAVSYHQVSIISLWQCALFRLAQYLVALILSVCLMYLVPKTKNLFSYIGQRTLGIYFLHILIRYVMQQLGYFTWLINSGRYEKLTVFGVVIIIVLVCSATLIHRFMIWLSRLWQPEHFLKK